jgi:hypothetical protein
MNNMHPKKEFSGEDLGIFAFLQGKRFQSEQEYSFF